MINFYTKYIPGDKYTNMLAKDLIDIPIYFISGIVIYYIGIRLTIFVGASSGILGGILLIIYGGPELDIPEFAYIFIIFLAKGGALLSSASVSISHVTLFPPAYTGLVIGIGTFCSRIVSSMSPLTAELELPTPMIIFITFCFLSYPAAFFLQIKDGRHQFRQARH